MIKKFVSVLSCAVVLAMVILPAVQTQVALGVENENQITQKEIFVNGVKIVYWEVDKGDQPIIFVHGNLASKLWFKPTLENLPEGYKAIAPDLPNFGDSGALKGEVTIKAYSDALFNFLSAIGIEEAIFVGQSIGGTIVMQFMVDHEPMVQKAMLIDPGPAQGMHYSLPVTVFQRMYLKLSPLLLPILLRLPIYGAWVKAFYARSIALLIPSLYGGPDRCFKDWIITGDGSALITLAILSFLQHSVLFVLSLIPTVLLLTLISALFFCIMSPIIFIIVPLYILLVSQILPVSPFLKELADDALKMKRSAYYDNAMALEKINIIDELQNVKVKTLITWGTQDIMVQLKDLKITAAAIQNSELRILEGIGHSFQLENPELFLETLKDFIEQPS